MTLEREQGWPWRGLRLLEVFPGLFLTLGEHSDFSREKDFHARLPSAISSCSQEVTLQGSHSSCLLLTAGIILAGTNPFPHVSLYPAGVSSFKYPLQASYH